MKRTKLPAATDTRRVKGLSILAVSAVGSKVLGPCCPQLRSHPAGQERWLGTGGPCNCKGSDVVQQATQEDWWSRPLCVDGSLNSLVYLLPNRGAGRCRDEPRPSTFEEQTVCLVSSVNTQERPP